MSKVTGVIKGQTIDHASITNEAIDDFARSERRVGTVTS